MLRCTVFHAIEYFMGANSSYISRQTESFSGSAKVPGDKSISHRSMMFGLLAEGETKVYGLLEGEDVLCTAEAAKALGANVLRQDDGVWLITGLGERDLNQPDRVLDMGNSGTSTRLLMGLVAGYDINVELKGDNSLSKRPMNRVIKPLAEMGVKVSAQENGRMPLTVHGSSDLKAISYELPVASAQVKSAILLAGLRAKGKTTVIENKPTRDHTETMLSHFGIEVKTEQQSNGSYKIEMDGQQGALKACDIYVPADPSSAAFPAVAASLVPGSDIRLEAVSLNDRRTGIYTCLKEMGVDISYKNVRVEAGESVADIVIKGGGGLKGITVPADRVASMIDEFPVFAMAASCADGTTTMTNLAELRVKESDRLALVAQGLRDCGVDLEEGEDSLFIHGKGSVPRGGAFIKTHLDHRIAMAFLVLGMVAEEAIEIDDASPIRTSFPEFIDLMNGLGALIQPSEAQAA